ncbi:rho guanine nucleotide exchange factor 39 isoform X2 [Anabrus simplex]|uniref:rho guanine nucleotide exchange factor 39 isoform X2 n=1 Tax=Anabrus simplex TaxID=316456 RepID=UPI0035A27AC5
MDPVSLCNTPQDRLTLSAELRNVIHERNILTTRTRLKVLSALDDMNKISNDEKQRSLRAQAIEEILTSEVSYLYQLELIMKYFMEPLKDMKCISSSTYSTLFGHIETLYKVNGELLHELKSNPKNIAAAFFKLAPFFKLYSVYAYDYKNVLTVLQEMQNNSSELSRFIQDQENHPEVGTKLPSLLITPIQRVPRYRLLLKEVLSLTPPTHPDYITLQGSLSEVEKTAEHINSLVQEQENMQKMIQIQRSLQNGRPSIITPGRKLLKEGLLMKVSPHGNKAHSRYFILFNDLLMYCKMLRTVSSLPNSLRCCCVLPLKKCIIEEILSRGMFKITCQNETFLLYSSVTEESESWITALKDAVKQYHESRQTLRKDSSSRRPMRRTDILKEINPFHTLKGNRKRRISVQDCNETLASPCENGTFVAKIRRHSSFNPINSRKVVTDECEKYEEINSDKNLQENISTIRCP